MKNQPQKILIIGSSNTDMVITTEEFPKPGETIFGRQFIMNPGGKGANQAVAATRLGAVVSFVIKTGKDVFGSYTLAALRHEGIDTSNIIKTSAHQSGVALITVNAQGENTIVVASGANMQLVPEEINEALLKSAGIILLQLEIPMKTIEHIVHTAKKYDCKLVLNPAPAIAIPASILHGLFLITPNETETEIITGIYPDTLPAMKKAGKYFLKKGVQNVIITVGERGAFLMNADHSILIPSPLVTPVDTTAAGDTFNGAIVTALAEGMDLPAACAFACKAASISVTRLGAQSSAPFRKEILN